MLRAALYVIFATDNASGHCLALLLTDVSQQRRSCVGAPDTYTRPDSFDICDARLVQLRLAYYEDLTSLRQGIAVTRTSSCCMIRLCL